MLSRRRLVVASVLALGLASAASAQRFRLREGPGVPPRFPAAHFGDGAFAHCKVMFSSNRPEPNGMGWATDYPYAGINLMVRLGELTKTPISLDGRGEPNYWVVRLTDDALFRCPFTMATDVGTADFSPAEAARLREYLLKGGFLWVDDFWGDLAWDQWAGELHKAVPEFPIVDVPPDHPIMHTLYQVDEVPQVSSINFWRRSGGSTAERGSESPHADVRMLCDDTGRILVLMTHNTDIGDSWEREGENYDFFLKFSPGGYAIGVNAVLYALSH
jgi:hypothetical protein